ncbi:YwdI family protein [Bacillus sp. 2205SS5-2]|uniref:YwdI family protein n=1 Tax=Bacillus sp. 2205SS5-2 TaxID=3109031 RepID=UPI0030052FA8
MNISHQSILLRMEKEIEKAKRGAQVREHLHVIKALCEVLLEEESESELSPVAFQKTVGNSPTPQPSSESVVVTETTKLKTDDGANGDSLFDF